MLNVAAVAFCDAIAWAYPSYTTARGWAAYAAALIGRDRADYRRQSLDATFVMHDTSHTSAGAGENRRVACEAGCRRTCAAIT